MITNKNGTLYQRHNIESIKKYYIFVLNRRAEKFKFDKYIMHKSTYFFNKLIDFKYSSIADAEVVWSLYVYHSIFLSQSVYVCVCVFFSNIIIILHAAHRFQIFIDFHDFESRRFKRSVFGRSLLPRTFKHFNTLVRDEITKSYSAIHIHLIKLLEQI